jgi:hypothetical protein
MQKKAKGNPTSTMLVITTGFLVVHLATHQKWALTVSLVAGLIGIFSPYLSKKVDFAWGKLTYLLSLVVPNILLSVVFYLFLFPIALLSKIFTRKDPLQLKRKNTTFVNVDRQYDKRSFETPW